MTYRRALLWLWIAGSVCWVGWWVWHDVTTCSLIGMSGSRAIACQWKTAEPGGMAVMSRTAPALTVLWHMAATAIVVPGYALIAGVVASWAIERFRTRRRRVGEKSGRA